MILMNLKRMKLNEILLIQSKRFQSTIENREESQSMFSKIRYVLNCYLNGSKLLYHRLKIYRQLKIKNRSMLTSIEKQFLYNFRYDIRVGIPIVLLFSLPIVGYSVPLIALFYSRYLPSTLILPKQKKKHLEEDCSISSSILFSLIQSNQNQINDPYSIYRILSMNFIFNQIFNEIKQIEDLINLAEYHSMIFNELFNLTDLSKEHLINLHRTLIHSSSSNLKFNSKSLIELDLYQWYQFIVDCDRSWNQEMIDKNSISDLVESLYLRGIYLHSKQMIEVIQFEQEKNLSSKQISNDLFIEQLIINDWKQILLIWIRIHQKLLNNSTNSILYFLHLPSILTKFFQEKAMMKKNLI